MCKRLLLLMIMVLGLSACSHLPEPTEDPSANHIAASNAPSWYYAQFRIPREKQQAPQWAIGTMIAGEIIQPVLKKHRENIQLWRFHRRAGNDKHGHVFSFIFYTDTASAKAIYQSIENQPAFLLLKKHHIEWLGSAGLHTKKKLNIEDTSDPVWPDNLQKSWPSFIMGVSETWLALVIDLASKQQATTTTLQRYEKVQEELNTLWQKQGKHAFFHHINAIFAYQPLMMRF